MVAVGRSNPTGGNFLVNLFFRNFFCLADILSDFLSDLLIMKNPNRCLLQSFKSTWFDHFLIMVISSNHHQLLPATWLWLWLQLRSYACPRCVTPHRLKLKFHLVIVARYGQILTSQNIILLAIITKCNLAICEWDMSSHAFLDFLWSQHMTQ